MLPPFPGVATVDLLLEPLDEVKIGAWAAKAQSMLAVAKRSLHVELPLYNTLGSANGRRAYADTLSVLFWQTASILTARPTRTVAAAK